MMEFIHHHLRCYISHTEVWKIMSFWRVSSLFFVWPFETNTGKLTAWIWCTIHCVILFFIFLSEKSQKPFVFLCFIWPTVCFFTVDLWSLKHKSFQAYVVHHVTTERALLLTQTILRVIAVSCTYRSPNMDNSKRRRDRSCSINQQELHHAIPIFFIDYTQAKTNGVKV